MASPLKNVRAPSPTGSVRSSGQPSIPRSNLNTMSQAPTYDSGRDKDEKDRVKIDYFYGNREKLSTFLIHLKLVYKLNPMKYEEASAKVIFAALHLKGPTFAWFKPTLRDWVNSDELEIDMAIYFAHFAEFELRIKKVFGTIAEGRAAARTIYTLKQKGSAATYYSKF